MGDTLSCWVVPHVNDVRRQIVSDFYGPVGSEIVKGGSPFLVGDCVIEVSVDVVGICLNVVDFGCVNKVTIHYFLLVDVLDIYRLTHRLTMPRLSPLMARELVQKRAVMVSP